MFRGVSSINLDTKGRMAVPTRYRDVLLEQTEGELVVTVSNEERCLLVYPLDEWVQVEKKLVALPSLNKAAQRLKRILIGHATDVTMDKAGRVLVSQPLREFAGIAKEAVLIGQGNKFELWDAVAWEKKRDEWLDVDGDDDDMSIDLESLSL